MNKIFELYVRNRVLFKNVFIVLIIAVCGVIYCIYGRRLIKSFEYGKLTAETVVNNETGWLVDSKESQSHNNLYESEKSESFLNQMGENYVYICGYVLNPGVYICKNGTRLYEVVDMAGGFLDAADKNYLNLVEVVTDGQKIYVPKEGEVISDNNSNSGASDFKVNINTADVSVLMTLPGIGQTRAKDIIAYREKNGEFTRIEDIMNVSGIKEAAYEKIKDFIIV